MVELESSWHPSTKLNIIGGTVDFTSVDPLPDDVTRDQIEEHCYTIRTLYGDYIDEIVDETTLSQREAQAWVLRNLVYEGADRLSYEAIGLYIWAIGRATDGDPLSRTIVSEYYQRAETKIERAEETVKRTGPPPYPDELYDEPALVWLDGQVADRLQRRLKPEETYTDLLERLLDETLADVSLRSLIERYETEHGTAYVAVETVKRDWDRELQLVVHTPTDGVTPDPVAEADAVRIGGQPYPFEITERSTIRREKSHLRVFDTAENTDRAAVTIDDGIERLDRILQTVEGSVDELVDWVEASGAVGLTVGTEPAAAGAHLYLRYPEESPIGDDDSSELPDKLAYLERIDLDDRTLHVGRITAMTDDEFQSMAAETVDLWAKSAAEGGPVELPTEPIDQRERFPAKVLRTA